MSTQIPLRTARIPALQRQCLFLRPQYQNRALLLNLSLRQTAGSPATRAFSSTPQRPRRSKLSQDKAQTRAAYEFQVVPSPNVNLAKAQKSTESVTEDIGLLQNTIVRAPFSKLKGEGAVDIMKYFWEIFKHKASALYSRYSYRSCIQKTGWTRFFPVDLFNNAEYTSLAKKYYEQIFYNFAKGNITPIKQICLSPLAKKLESRIAARGPVQLEWQLHGPFKSSRVVSHRAAPLGAEQPDTAYRQVIVRLVSEQSLRAVPLSSTSSSSRRSIDRLPWVPDAARQQAEKRRQREVKHEAEDGIVDAAAAEDQVAEEKAVPKTVVDYLVLQKRVIRGKEEDWKVWGFAEECTPEVIERDQEYWRRMLDATAAAGRF